MDKGAKATGDAWDKTKEKTGDAWDATKEKTGDAWDTTKEKTHEASDVRTFDEIISISRILINFFLIAEGVWINCRGVEFSTLQHLCVP